MHCKTIRAPDKGSWHLLGAFSLGLLCDVCFAVVLPLNVQAKAAQCLVQEDLNKIELALREFAVPGPAAMAGMDPDDLWINYDGFTQVRGV